MVFDITLENKVQGFDDVNIRKQYDRFYLRSFGIKTFFIKGSGGPYTCPSCLSPCGSRGSSHRTLNHLPDKEYTTRLEIEESSS